MDDHKWEIKDRNRSSYFFKCTVCGITKYDNKLMQNNTHWFDKKANFIGIENVSCNEFLIKQILE